MRKEELAEVLERAKFRAECANKKTGTEFAWFVIDELEKIKCTIHT